MSLGSDIGDVIEYAVSVDGEGIEPYVSDVSRQSWFAHGSVKRHAGPGMRPVIVERTVTYGPWRISE